MGDRCFLKASDSLFPLSHDVPAYGIPIRFLACCLSWHNKNIKSIAPSPSVTLQMEENGFGVPATLHLGRELG